MSRTWSSIAAVLVLGAAAAGCSAIVQPDETRLRPGTDGGRSDSGGVEVDAQVPDGGGPGCPGGCDDGVACTDDSCSGSSCEHAPDDGACAGGERCNPVMGCVPLRCSSDGECDDGDACNGAERCDPSSTTPSGCVAGTPVACDDGVACTDDECDPGTGACTSTPVHARCDDLIDCTTDTCSTGGAGDGCGHVANDAMCNDGFCEVGGRCDLGAGCVGGTPRDCDDRDGCDDEVCDADAMMCVSTPRDADGDGHPVARSGGGGCPGGTDCNDADGAVHPGAAEICTNGRDEDCDGVPDDGCPVVGTPGDVCGAALPIPIDAATMVGRVNGTFSSFDDDYRFECGQDDGRDAVYYFDLTGVSDVVIDTVGSSGGQDTVLGLGFDCAAPPPPTVCNDDQDPFASTSIITSRMFLHRVGPAPGGAPIRIYVYVDAYNGSSTGNFQLNVQIRRAAADSCASEPLDISGGGTVLGVGVFATSGTTQRGSCQSIAEIGEGEAIFRIRRPGDGEHHRIDAYSADFTPDVYVRDSPCGSGTERACDTGGSVGGVNTAGVTVGSIPSTSMLQFLFVDGMLGSSPSGGPPVYMVVYDP